MPILTKILQAFVLTLFLWVSVFRVGTTFDLAVRTVGLSFFGALAIALPLILTHLRHSYRKTERGERRFAATVVLIGLSLSLPVLFLSRPDADDVGYMHQYLVDAANLSEPFTSDYFGLPFGGSFRYLQGLSEHEAYEALVAVGSGLLGLDALGIYHNGLPILLCVMWAITLSLLLRRFRLGRRAAVVGVLSAAAFLLLDGNVHTSQGNMSFLRIWQGKAVSITILLPAYFLFWLRFLGTPRKRRAALILALALTMAAINRSMILMLPVVTVSIFAAWGIGFGRLRQKWRRLLTGLLPVLIFVGLAAAGVLVAARSFLTIEDASAALDAMKDWRSYSGHYGTLPWWQRIYQQVAGSPWILVRDLWLLFVAPWFLCRRPLRRFLPLFTLFALLLSYSPWMGALWYFLAEVVAFRLYYTLPLALAAGLAVGAVVENVQQRDGRFRVQLLPLSISLGSILLIAIAVKTPVWSADNSVFVKSPLQYRLDPKGVAYAEKFTPLVLGKRVLAPNVLANLWAVTHPTSINLLGERWMNEWKNSPERFLTQCPKARGHFLTRLLSSRPPPTDVIVLNRCNGTVYEQFALHGYILEPLHPLDDPDLQDLAAYAIVQRPEHPTD